MRTFERGWRLKNLHADLLENTALYVSQMMEHLERLENEPMCYSLKYEDLVSNPEKVARGFLTFLNEPWDPNVIYPWEQSHNFGTEDPLSRSLKKFRPSIGN
ncbi:sulfotransferase [Parvularcula sp. IMCC14364]|uniref:sulfotransferase n=1 Tax=Parvularcula sp. IMCC14364 TaxID=3067902 RepID=UPI003558FB5C